MSEREEHERAGNLMRDIWAIVDDWRFTQATSGKSTWPGHRHYLDRVRKLLSASPVLAESETANCEAKIADAYARGRRDLLAQAIELIEHHTSSDWDEWRGTPSLFRERLEKLAKEPGK